MIMKHVNPNFFSNMLGPLVGMADGDDDEYQNLNPNSEEEVKKIIIDVLKPNFEEFSQEKKEKCKRTLSYYLTTSKIDFDGIFASNLLPFEPPTEPRLFFIWLWEVLFEDEDYLMENPDQFVERNDIYEPNRG
jgi:hypothetical protein